MILLELIMFYVKYKEGPAFVIILVESWRWLVKKTVKYD